MHAPRPPSHWAALLLSGQEAIIQLGADPPDQPGRGTILKRPSARNPASVSRAECVLGCRYVALSSAPGVPTMVLRAAPARRVPSGGRGAPVLG